jgi:exodeoxyribonuclease V gamma subunit
MKAGLQVFPHSSLTDLLRAVSGRTFLKRRTPSPRPLTVVVPSLSFADAWQRGWADLHGVCMGFAFRMPRDFLHELTGRAGAHAPDVDLLTWRIWSCWRAGRAHWTKDETTSREDWLAASGLANLIDQYEHDRPEWIAEWADDRSALPGNVATRWRESEKWQRELWREVRGAATAENSVALTLRDWENRLARKPELLHELARDFPEVLVLGTGSLDPLLVRALRCLAAAGSKVDVHVILSSLDYLGDLRTCSAPLSVTLDPEEVELGVGHPLWQAQGRHAAGAFALLGQLDEQFTHWPHEKPEEKPRPSSLLARLQEDLRWLQMPRQEECMRDGSLLVHACFGPRRELEVLRDELRRALRELPDLRLDEIFVAVTDWETYAPLVDAVFGGGNQPLPVRLMETLPGEEAPVISAWRWLLEAAHQRHLPASGILELVQNPAVQRFWGWEPGTASADENLQIVRHWLIESGWMKGEILENRADQPGSLTAAADRLAAGHWLGAADFTMDCRGEWLFPVADPLPHSEEWVDAWWTWLGSLQATLREWSNPADPAEWAERLQRSLGTMIADEEETRELIRPWLAGLRAAGGCGAADAATLLVWLAAKSGREGRRTPLTGKITFGRLRQLQHLPCRVLAMAGLGETQFPGNTRRNAWDLRAAQPRLWDRNARIDDRQLFLDALVTPQDRLILTAPVRNVRSGRLEPFSACVEELLRTIEEMGTPRQEIIIHHPLFPFSPAYFANREDLPKSFEESDLLVARALRGPRDQPPAWWEMSAMSNANHRIETSLTVTDLARFWKDPAKGFLRLQEVDLPREAAADEGLDAPPLECDSLQLWTLKEAMWECLAAGGDPEAEWWLAREQANRNLPPDFLGGELRNRVLTGVRGLWEKWGTIVQGSTGIHWTSAPGISLAADFFLAAEPEAIMCRCWKKAEQPKHFWEPWLLALLSAAAENPLPILLLQEDSPSGLLLPSVETAKAQALLEGLLAGWQQAREHPIAYAPATSEKLAEMLAAEDADETAAWQAALGVWWKEDTRFGQGEGNAAEARFVWRDVPLDDHRAEWVARARQIAAPLMLWRKSGEKL